MERVCCRWCGNVVRRKPIIGFWHLCVSTEERAEVDAIHLSQEAAMALRKALGQCGDT